MRRPEAHHQLNDVRKAVASHQLVIFIGARGTGKTLLKDELAGEWRRSGVDVVSLSASAADELESLNQPVANALGCDVNSLPNCSFMRSDPVRVIVDDCHTIFDASWLGQFQDQWRALLTQPEARGKLSVLLLGRPKFRSVVGGRGSPLMNVAKRCTARPLQVAEVITHWGIADRVATAVLRKTGGHPATTQRLIDLLDDDLERMHGAMELLAASESAYLVRLVDDHGIGAIGILRDVIDSNGAVSADVLIRKHFGAEYALGLDAVDDLRASGLVTLDDVRCVALAAHVLHDLADVRRYIRIPPIQIPTDAPGEHARGASTLFRLENSLRHVVANELAIRDDAWWSTRIDETIVGVAESRWIAERESALPIRDAHPILYLSLGELLDVIAARQNWGEIFGPLFDLDRSAFDRAKTDLLTVRHKIGHNRPLDQGDIDALLRAGTAFGIAREKLER